jgi:N-formylglutamate amidohydrolase
MMMEEIEPALITEIGPEPLVAAAIHDGHHVRGELLRLMQIHAAARLREEDPFTASWTNVAATRIVGLRSRFEVDLNRPRDRAIYRTPEDAWGLRLWNGAVPEDACERSLQIYDEFYGNVRRLFEAMERRFGKFVVLDLHSYNHRRAGSDAEPADPELNPDVNIGTGTMDRSRWAPVVDRLIRELRAGDFPHRSLDVRENVRFFGGQFPRWIHESFPETGCAIAIEVKKFFMDEWTGEPVPVYLDAFRKAIEAAVPGILEEIRKL